MWRERTPSCEDMKGERRRSVVREQVVGHVIHGRVRAETEEPPVSVRDVIDVTNRERGDVGNAMKFDEARRIGAAQIEEILRDRFSTAVDGAARAGAEIPLE